MADENDQRNEPQPQPTDEAVSDVAPEEGDDLQAIREDLDQLKADLRELGGRLRERAQQELEEAGLGVGGSSTGHDGPACRLGAEIDQVLDDARRAVEEHPMASALSAMALGMMLGASMISDD